MNNNTKYAQVLDDPVARNLRAMIDARISAIDAQELRAGIGRRMMANRNIATTMMARAPLPQLPDLYQQADQRMNNAGSGSFVRHDIITLQHASSVGAKQSTKLLVGIIVLAFIALTVWYICKKRRREQQQRDDDDIVNVDDADKQKPRTVNSRHRTSRSSRAHTPSQTRHNYHQHRQQEQRNQYPEYADAYDGSGERPIVVSDVVQVIG